MTEFAAVNENNPEEEKPLAEFVQNGKWQSLPPGVSRFSLMIDWSSLGGIALGIAVGVPVMMWRLGWYSLAFLSGSARTSLETGWQDGRGPSAMGALFDQDADAAAIEQEEGA